jgi:hypothetical protein
MNAMNKKGMTLVELLVYIALAALLLAPIIFLINNSSVNMTRDAAGTELRISGRDLLNIIYDDLKNTGFKLKPEDLSVVDSITYTTYNTETPPVPLVVDKSSIKPEAGVNDAFDKLTIRSGKLAGNAWGGWEEITYEVTGVVSNRGKLKRTITTYDPDNVTVVSAKSGTTELAQNVIALQFEYAPDLDMDAYDWRDNPSATATINIGAPPIAVPQREAVKYIRVNIVLEHENKIAANTKNTPEILHVGNYTVPAGGQVLRERYEMVIPIPNNGLFPPPPL